MASLDLAVVTRSVDLDPLMPDAQLGQRPLEERRSMLLCIDVRELRAIVRLYALDHIRELLHAMPDELCGGIGTMLFEGFQVTEPTVFVEEGILVIIASVFCCIIHRIAHQTRDRDVFHIDLHPLTWVVHLLIRLRRVFGVGQLYRHLALPTQDSVEAGDGSAVAAFPELHPEHDQAVMRVPAAHVADELELLGRVLVRMAMRSVGTVLERL